MLEGKATLKPGGAWAMFSFIDSKASLFSLVQNHPLGASAPTPDSKLPPPVRCATGERRCGWD